MKEKYKLISEKRRTNQKTRYDKCPYCGGNIYVMTDGVTLFKERCTHRCYCYNHLIEDMEY